MDGDGTKVEGAIRPKPDARNFDLESWCKFIGERPELRPSDRNPNTFKNPFTGGDLVLPPPPRDLVNLVLEGQVVGSAWWSMNEEPLVNVSVEKAALPKVLEWAQELGGEFQLDPTESIARKFIFRLRIIWSGIVRKFRP